MGFGSIQGVPPLLPVVRPQVNSDLQGVFAAEFSRQQGREAESREESRRGLESEEEDELLGDPAEDVPASGLNLFA